MARPCWQRRRVRPGRGMQGGHRRSLLSEAAPSRCRSGGRSRTRPAVPLVAGTELQSKAAGQGQSGAVGGQGTLFVAAWKGQSRWATMEGQ